MNGYDTSVRHVGGFFLDLASDIGYANSMEFAYESNRKWAWFFIYFPLVVMFLYPFFEFCKHETRLQKPCMLGCLRCLNHEQVLAHKAQD